MMAEAIEGVRDATNTVPERPYEGLVNALVAPRMVECDMIAVPAEDADAHATIAALRAQVAAMHADWNKLNEFLNVTAINRDWCEEYEERLTNYNAHFTVQRLVGRQDRWYGNCSTWTTTDGSDYRRGRPF